MLKNIFKLLDKSYQGRCMSCRKDILLQTQKINTSTRLSINSKENYEYEMSKIQKSQINHHSSFADQWWDLSGPLKGLHILNGIRVPFIRDGLIARSGDDKHNENINTTRVLRDKTILEVGCGGGILTEQLARLGAKMTAIDLSHDVIRAAREHLENESTDLLENITYKAISIEAFAKDHNNSFDAVVLSEVLEHVDNKVSFLTASVQCLKPGGSLFITTFNKTIPMWICGVLIAEYVINLIPKGTHSWDLMISPLDLQRILDTLGCETVFLNGSFYNPLTQTCSWINSTALSYALQAIKTEI